MSSGSIKSSEQAREIGAGTQFKKGTSGNPQCRPVDLISRHLTKYAKAKEPVEVEIEVEGGQKKIIKIANGDSIARILLNKAAKGDLKAIEMVLERLEGKVKQDNNVDLNIKVEQPLFGDGE